MGVKKIKLSNSTKFILVDEEDFEELNKFSWRLHGGYAVREVKMHREIIGISDFDENLIHHKNQDKLDNRKENLTKVNKSKHIQIHNKNRNGKGSNKVSKTWHGFRYIYCRKDGKWLAQITYHKFNTFLGVYVDPVSANYVAEFVRNELNKLKEMK